MDDFLTIVIAFVVMCVVIYLSYLGSKMLAKSSTKMYSTKYMKLVDRLSLGKERYLIILKIGDKNFLTAVTDERIEILKEMNSEDLVDLDEMESFENTGGVPGFKDALGSFMGKKKK